MVYSQIVAQLEQCAEEKCASGNYCIIAKLLYDFLGLCLP